MMKKYASGIIPLTETPVGNNVRIADFSSMLDPLQREQLDAYGLSNQHPIRVLQQRPLTVVLCDQVEIALEHVIAKQLWVEAINVPAKVHQPIPAHCVSS